MEDRAFRRELLLASGLLRSAQEPPRLPLPQRPQDGPTWHPERAAPPAPPPRGELPARPHP